MNDHAKDRPGEISAVADLLQAPILQLPLKPDAFTPDTTLAVARRHLAAALREAGVESADVDARLLVCAAVDIDHAGLIRDPDRPLDAAVASLVDYATRRLRCEPVSRILGHREFWGLPFAIGPAVLDPRPETEGLVASVLDAVGGRRDQKLAILDLGTGSGVILGILLRELPLAHGIGIDHSLAACRIAGQNFKALAVADRAGVVCGDWAAAVRGRFDIVVSNPPYIATTELPGLARDVRDYDPIAALDGGGDGLAAYRALVPRLSSLLCLGGVAAFECGASQGASVAGLLDAAGLAATAVYRDLAGHDRVVIASAPAKYGRSGH